eukprot:SAG11_NODE_3114_length_2677_cov_1.685415_3_plen_223_part_00
MLIMMMELPAGRSAGRQCRADMTGRWPPALSRPRIRFASLPTILLCQTLTTGGYPSTRVKVKRLSSLPTIRGCRQSTGLTMQTVADRSGSASVAKLGTGSLQAIRWLPRTLVVCIAVPNGPAGLADGLPEPSGVDDSQGPTGQTTSEGQMAVTTFLLMPRCRLLLELRQGLGSYAGKLDTATIRIVSNPRRSVQCRVDGSHSGSFRLEWMAVDIALREWCTY